MLVYVYPSFMIYLLVLYRIDKIIGSPQECSIQIELIVRFQNSQYSTVKTSSQPLIVFHSFDVGAGEREGFIFAALMPATERQVQPKQA